jgi:cytochrome P450
VTTTYPESSVRRPTGAPPDAARVDRFVDIDLTSAATFGQGVPHAAFDTLRAGAPVAWHDGGAANEFYGGGTATGFWAVTSHALVAEVSRSPGVYSSWLGATLIPEVDEWILVMLRQMILNMDAPDHTRLRRVLQPIFTPRAVERIRDAVTYHAVEVVDALAAAGTGDLVETVAAEMPLRVLADLMGIPAADRHLIFEWSNHLIGLDDPEFGGDPGEAMGALAACLAYGKEVADDRRAHPTDDLISLIANAVVDGEQLSDTEFGMFWLLLIVAGNETTRNSLTGAVLALHEQELWTSVVDDPSLLSTAVDELVRHVSPVLHFRRTAAVDTVLGGQAIRAGDKVAIWYAAANRDPGVFDDPHALLLTRDPNPHLAFGLGPHVCLGAHLARLQVRAVLEELVTRVPELRIDGPATRVHSNFINGISRLPVRCDS